MAQELKAFEVTGKALFGRFYTKKVYDKDEVDAEIRRLKRALWLARAWRAKERQRMLPNNKEFYMWQAVERKCRAKVEEYK